MPSNGGLLSEVYNLASVFALAGHKTVLIGADLRKPKIHEDFDVNEKIGLSSFLINKCSVDEAIQKSDVQNKLSE